VSEGPTSGLGTERHSDAGRPLRGVAIQDFDRALKIDPKDADAIRHGAEAIAKKNNWSASGTKRIACSRRPSMTGSRKRDPGTRLAMLQV